MGYFFFMRIVAFFPTCCRNYLQTPKLQTVCSRLDYSKNDIFKLYLTAATIKLTNWNRIINQTIYSVDTYILNDYLNCVIGFFSFCMTTFICT